MSDLASNPFVALFGSIDQVRLYQTSVKDSTRDGGQSEDVLGTSLQVRTVKCAPSDVALHEINRIIEDVFLITVDLGCDRRENRVFLEDLFESSNGNKFLGLDTLKQAVFERVMISEPCRHLVFTDSTTSSLAAAESHPVDYLFNSFVRLKGVMRCNKQEVEEYTRSQVYTECLRVIVLNTRLCFQQPTLLTVNRSPAEIFVELFTSTSQDVDLVQEYFELLSSEVDANKDDGSLLDVFRPALEIVQQRLTQTTLSRSDVLPLADICLFFTRNKCLAEVLSVFIRPRDASQGRHYEDTLLGCLLSFGCLASLDVSSAAEFFDRPSRLTQTEVDSIENMIYQLLDAVQSRVYQLVYSLLKFGGTIKDSMLDWLGGCLHANKGRAKMWSHQMLPQMFNSAFSSDSFFLNLGCLMLRLSAPLTSSGGSQRLTLKVQPTYCMATVGDRQQRKVHMIDVKETCLVPASDGSPPPQLNLSYTFLTECFFMTHYCLHVGFRTLHERLVKLNQDLHRVQQIYTDLVQQGGNMSDTTVRLKQDMERVMTVYLSLKAALTQPAFLDSCFAFLVATASYLVAMATDCHVSGGTSSDADSSTIILQCIPELLVENVQDFMLFLRRFKDQLFEQCCGDELSELLTFIMTFMGSPHLMRNPHLRAGMAEVLETLLPTKSAAANTSFHSTHFQRERLFQTHPLVEQLATSLVSVFVSIEMTGQGVQFEHKFKYRQPMYVALEYIWNIGSHRQALKAMAKYAEVHIEDTEAPLFLRFINLLINDAIYLLDEALSYMSQIKQKQELREGGAWPTLPAGQRSEAESGYRHMSMLARFHNIMGNETIHALVLITSDIRSIFTNSLMVDRIATMLNYFLLHLVGPKKKNLKVKDFDEFQFRPRKLVADICHIYVQLGGQASRGEAPRGETETLRRSELCVGSESFCRAVSRDGRSYSHSLFEQAELVLCKIHEPADLIAQFNQLALHIQTLCSQQEAEEEMLGNVPEDFIDPIMGDLMRDPVVLPSSGKIVDRSTIARHILSDQFDPFNRQPLTMDLVQPATQLKQQIDNWIATQTKLKNS